jgi:uncharacterized membrane protein
VLRDEADAILRSVRAVRGVRAVEDRLERHDVAGHIPELQGPARTPEPGPDVLQREWAPATRSLAMALGIGGAALGSRVFHGPARLVAAGLGALLALRGATNLELRTILGIPGARQGIEVIKTITIDAPPERVFELWDHIERFPRYMSHVREVERREGDVSHWMVRGPVGIPIEFDAQTTERVPGELLAWRSIPDQPIRHSGVVRFEPVDEGRTRASVRMSYEPPGGLFGHAIASLAGTDPKHALDEDLVRLKSLLEHGKTTADGHETVLESIEGDRSGRGR